MKRAQFWPNPLQALLLGVCLRQKHAAALRCWQEWKAQLGFAGLDEPSLQLAPLVLWRLRELGLPDSEAKQIRERLPATPGPYAFRATGALLKALQRVKIRTVLLGGAALSRSAYPDPSARGLDDTRILVPAEDAARAIDLLGSHGWNARDFEPFRTVEDQSSVPLQHSLHGEALLHWRVLNGRSRTGQSAWWRAAQPFACEQVQTHLPAPADHLLYLCESGLSGSGLRWLADCTLLIRHAGLRLDWLRLVKQADRFALTLHTRATLVYLRRHFEDSVPIEIIGELRRARVPLENRIGYFLARRSGSKQNDLIHKLGAAARRYLG